MKKKILKVLALVACAVLLVVGSIAGTLAFLTDETEVTNTFTVGNVSITMDEATVNEYGEQKDDAGNEITTRNLAGEGNEYKLIPNHTYVKDPTIRVGENSEDCYVFFRLENGLGDDATFNIDSTKWVEIEEGVYYYTETLSAKENCVAFTEFKLSGTADVEELEDEVIKVTAYAVQADGFANAAAAWTATFGAPQDNG